MVARKSRLAISGELTNPSARESSAPACSRCYGRTAQIYDLFRGIDNDEHANRARQSARQTPSSCAESTEEGGRRRSRRGAAIGRGPLFGTPGDSCRSRSCARKIKERPKERSRTIAGEWITKDRALVNPGATLTRLNERDSTVMSRSWRRLRTRKGLRTISRENNPCRVFDEGANRNKYYRTGPADRIFHRVTRPTESREEQKLAL